MPCAGPIVCLGDLISLGLRAKALATGRMRDLKIFRVCCLNLWSSALWRSGGRHRRVPAPSFIAEGQDLAAPAVSDECIYNLLCIEQAELIQTLKLSNHTPSVTIMIIDVVWYQSNYIILLYPLRLSYCISFILHPSVEELNELHKKIMAATDEAKVGDYMKLQDYRIMVDLPWKYFCASLALRGPPNRIQHILSPRSINPRFVNVSTKPWTFHRTS